MPATSKSKSVSAVKSKSPSIPLSEFSDRRQKLMRGLRGAVGLLFAGSDPTHGDRPWRPHPHFEYFTGVVDEPEAALLIDPTNPVEARRVTLFLRPLNPEVEKWDGLRTEISKALRDRYGVRTIFRIERLPLVLRDAVRRTKRVACLHPFAMHTQPVSPDLAVFQNVATRIPGVVIEDQTDIPARLRSIKSRNEVAVMQHAINITREGFARAAGFMAPGMNEFDVQEAMEHTYRTNGARDTAFGTIVGGGINATVLHYRANNQPLNDGELVCIDSGARYGGYSADITRTFPINGTFSKRQREIYNLVLKAEEAAIRAVKPGVTIAQVDAAAREIITKAGFGDTFIHGIGHHLGLETHDINPDTKLEPGNVLTIEPGIYLADERIGVRIEDDILVTKDGRRNLSSHIPKQADEIEKWMKAQRKIAR